MKSSTTQAALIQEAATWMMRLSDNNATEADWTAWRQWTSQSDEHSKYATLTESLTEKLRSVPAAGVGRVILDAPRVAARRTALKTLALLLVAAPTGYVASTLPWREWDADYRTGTGEQHSITLPDGGSMTLDTGSAVNVTYDQRGRTVAVLKGRVYIATAVDTSEPTRPFIVQTAQGLVRALGTRFEVQQFAAEGRVAVFEGAVEITPADSGARSQVLQAGWQARFNGKGVQPFDAVSAKDLSWLQKRIQVENIPLGNLIAELARYRPGILRCDSEVAALPVSGSYRLDDTDLALKLLSDSLPVRVTRRTAYWVTVGPR